MRLEFRVIELESASLSPIFLVSLSLKEPSHAKHTPHTHLLALSHAPHVLKRAIKVAHTRPLHTHIHRYSTHKHTGTPHSTHTGMHTHTQNFSLPILTRDTLHTDTHTTRRYTNTHTHTLAHKHTHSFSENVTVGENFTD